MCNSFGELWKSQDEKQHKLKAACLSAALSANFCNGKLCEQHSYQSGFFRIFLIRLI